MAKQQHCPKCDLPLTGEPHEATLCLTTERNNLKAENAKLKQSVVDWKDAWFNIRDLIGKMSWEHLNCPHQPKPILNNGPDPFMDFSIQLVQQGKDVYQRTQAGWRLIGSSSSEEGAASIIRLLSQ